MKIGNGKINRKGVIAIGVSAVVALSCLTLWSQDNMQKGFFYNWKMSTYPGISAVFYSDGTDEWKNIEQYERMDNSGEVTSYLEYNHLTAKHVVTCNAPLKHDIEIRVLDEDGNIIVEPAAFSNGDTLSLDSVKTNEKYVVQYKYPYEAGVALNFS